MTTPSPTVVTRVPTTAEYLRLRDAAGLSPFAPDAAEIGLRATLHAVVIEQAGEAIGMGRLVGDGGCFVQVVDIAVDPRHQGRGIGTAIMAALTDHITHHLPPSTYVSLIADVPADRLYERFGFRATAPASIGMARRAG